MRAGEVSRSGGGGGGGGAELRHHHEDGGGFAGNGLDWAGMPQQRRASTDADVDGDEVLPAGV
jgi:hypothetical protein